MSTSLNSWCIPPQHCCHRRFLSSAPLERCSHQRSTLQQHWAQATRLRAPLAAAYSEGGTPFSRPRADLGTNSDAAASSSSSGSSGGRSRAAYPDRANPGSGGDGGNSSSFSRFSGEAGAPTAPWALMGRVIREDSVDLWQGAREALVARAVAERCGGLTDQELSERLQALANLVPTLSERLLMMRADLLTELVADVGAVAQKLVQLKVWFPTADLGQLLSRRPTLLTQEEFELVPAARQQLLARYPEPSSRGSGSSSGSSSGQNVSSSVVDFLVTQQPLLLVEDLEALLAELQRLLPGVSDPASALLRAPGLADSVTSNRKLSLWLLPGQDVLRLLAANPGIILSLQRGTRALGPGAEFMA